MAKEKKTKLAALVREWERIQPYTLESLVIRTAAHLSGVRDVPKGVLNCLDALGRDDSRYLATQVDEVLRFLRELLLMEQMGIRELDSRGSGGQKVDSSILQIKD